MSTTTPTLEWQEHELQQERPWLHHSHQAVPKHVHIADDSLSADTAYRLACEGTGLLWRGDFQNAKNLLQAIARRIDHKPKKAKKTAPTNDTPLEAFHKHRQQQAHRARVLNMLLIEVDADFHIPLRRAPDIKQACHEAYGETASAFVTSLRELLGIIGAHEWRKNGVFIPALQAKIHPYYGIFSPVRGEYLDLIAKAPLPSTQLAFDIGTGSGVIAALLAKRGVAKIIATDLEPRALTCAAENARNLGVDAHIEFLQTDLFPAGRAPLIVCNPPWLPLRPNSVIENAIYDPDSRMLKGFLAGLKEHLELDGEAWLIMSDLAEHLGLRSHAQLWSWIELAGMKVAGKLDIRPQHKKTQDETDPLHQARAAEITSLWRLRHQ